MRLPGDPPPENLRDTAVKLVFVPNNDNPITVNESIRRRMGVSHIDPETAVVIPFSELEGSISSVDTNLSIDGQPVKMDVIGDFGFPAIVEPDKTSVLGEKLVDELDSFDPLHPTEISNQTTAYIVGDNEHPFSHVVASDEDLTKLEQLATGEAQPSRRLTAGADIDG